MAPSGQASTHAPQRVQASMSISPRVGHRPQARRPVDGLHRRQPALVVVGPGFGTDRRAVAAAGAARRVHVARLVPHPGGERARLPFQPSQLGVGQQVDVLPGLALEGGAEGGLAGAASGRCRRSWWERCGPAGASNRRWPARVQQVHLVPQLRQVHRRRHPRDARAYHETPALLLSAPVIPCSTRSRRRTKDE